MARQIVYRRISFKDLEECGYSIGLMNDDGKTIIDPLKSTSGIYEAINFLGVKTNSALEVQGRCQHVRISGKRVYGFSLIGEERNDREWLTGGFASEEVKLSTSKMGDMLETVNRLKRGGV